jgi:hypothetical protein
MKPFRALKVEMLKTIILIIQVLNIVKLNIWAYEYANELLKEHD